MSSRIFFICLLLLPSFATALSYTLKITQQELQEKLAKQLPIEKKAAYISAKIVDARVDLIEGGDEIAVFTKIDLLLLGSIKGAAQAYVKGRITYNQEKGAFYLIKPNIVSLEIEEIPADLVSEIKKIMQISLEKAVQIYPIYKFNEKNIQEKMAKSLLESIQVKEQTLLIKMTLL